MGFTVTYVACGGRDAQDGKFSVTRSSLILFVWRFDILIFVLIFEWNIVCTICNISTAKVNCVICRLMKIVARRYPGCMPWWCACCWAQWCSWSVSSNSSRVQRPPTTGWRYSWQALPYLYWVSLFLDIEKLFFASRLALILLCIRHVEQAKNFKGIDTMLWTKENKLSKNSYISPIFLIFSLNT